MQLIEKHKKIVTCSNGPEIIYKIEFETKICKRKIKINWFVESVEAF